jgi:hypothetical protein
MENFCSLKSTDMYGNRSTVHGEIWRDFSSCHVRVCTSLFGCPETGQQSLCHLRKESLCHAQKLTPVIWLDHAANGTILLDPLRFPGRMRQNFAASAREIPAW